MMPGLEFAPLPEGPWFDRFKAGVKNPRGYIRGITGDYPVAPLLVLFGLNAIDELDRSAFGVLLPNIRDSFGLDNAAILAVVAGVVSVSLLLQTPIAHLADRGNRVGLALSAAMIMAVFSGFTGIAFTVWMLYISRAGSGLSKALIDPTHNSLLADYYPVDQRPRVYSFHRAANGLGQFIGPIFGGLVGYWLGWRAPFFFFMVPAVILVLLGRRHLREPVRGAQERKVMGASAEVTETEEDAPSLGEAWRMMRKVRTLQRIFRAMPFLAPGMIGFMVLGALKYEALGLDEAQRGFAAAATEPFGLIGAYWGARFGMKLFRQKGPGEILRFVSAATFATAVFAGCFAFAPSIGFAVAANAAISMSLAIVLPGVFASLSLTVPPRARATGFSVGALWVFPGLIILPVVGWVSDAHGIEWGMLLLTPTFVIGGLIMASAHKLVAEDITQVWTATAARSELLLERRQGRSKLLLVRGLDVSYGSVQILFDIDFEVDSGEIVALLGTNGAGKSTLLKAICGVVQANRGTVIMDGRDITHAPAHEIAGFGIAQVPGGQGVFPSLTVAENLRVAGWMERRRPAERDARVREVLELFPVLEERLNDPAGNLSGGQQQMLALGMAFLSRPKLLCIDELSLGLAPVVVEQLLGVVRKLRDNGTTIILVEQSVNVALTVAETAYFMEKGEIRFRGPTAELLDRPDVLRSVFLEGAGKGLAAVGVGGGEAPDGAMGGNGSKPEVGLAKASPGNGQDAEHHLPTAEVPGIDLEALARPDLVRRDAPPALEVFGLSVTFGGIRAVNDVSFALSPGEILGIIGPNGAGKTTLYDLICGYTRADVGRVVLGGTDIGDLKPDARARLGLGRSFQDARLFPAMTVEETIKVAFDRWVDVRDPFNAALHLPAEYESELEVDGWVDELIELLGIESFRSKFIRELSTGSRRVVDLACVLALRPSVVLLDEPSSGIAQREAEALAPLLLRIRENLMASVLVIEHDMPLITSVADRMLALDQGAVVVTGSAEEVLEHPHVVASYLGATEEVIARSGARG